MGDLDIVSQREEINLNYVAVTKTKLAIALHNTVIGMMRNHVSKTNSPASGLTVATQSRTPGSSSALKSHHKQCLR
ncbi:hypothetical protein DXT77_28835 [Pseudomonas sp. 91RF]|jgi:hypothetical protein|nr:hypothetical protein DXT77_28835 [Pseudomonas sp. 91RF]